MAKMWGVPDGRLAQQMRKYYTDMQNRRIDQMLYKKDNTPRPGIKTTVMMVYTEKGKLAAWQALQEYNERISGGGFTLEMLENWIGEYEKQQSQKVGKDDGYNR